MLYELCTVVCHLKSPRLPNARSKVQDCEYIIKMCEYIMKMKKNKNKLWIGIQLCFCMPFFFILKEHFNK